jgi:hypothetical protein
VFFAGKWAFNFVAIAEDGFSGNFAAFSVTIISAIIFVHIFLSILKRLLI